VTFRTLRQKVQKGGPAVAALLGAGLLAAGVGSAQGAGVAAAVAIQPDGKIVVAGEGEHGGKEVFGLARYRTGGSLDTTFGRRGLVTAPMDRSPSAFAAAGAIAIEPDGKIVVAGGSGDYASKSLDFRFAVSRYTTTGAPDPGFGKHGTTRTAFAPLSATANALAIQPDGKILVVGQRWNRGSEASQFVLERYEPDGLPDTSIVGEGGGVVTAFSKPAGADAVVLLPDGRFVVAGWTGTYFHDRFALARYEPNGSLDTTFGTGGIVTTAFGSQTDDGVQALALQPDGKILAVGTTATGSKNEFALARYNAGGTLDPTFGTGGLVTTLIGPLCECDLPYGGAANAVALQPDGKIVVAGEELNGGARGAFALARYRPDGSLDTGFGTGGTVTTSFGFSEPANGTSGDAATAVALQPDGKIVATGYSNYGPHAEQYLAALARYNPDGSLDGSFGSGGKRNTSIAVCVVPRVKGMRLRRARLVVVGSHCSVGRITRVSSKRVRKAWIVSQKPRPGSVGPDRAKVRLVVSK